MFNVNCPIASELSKMESQSMPHFVNGMLLPKKIEKVINGKKVAAHSKMNHGRSGKLYTTLWYIDGVRTAKAKLVGALI